MREAPAILLGLFLLAAWEGLRWTLRVLFGPVWLAGWLIWKTMPDRLPWTLWHCQMMAFPRDMFYFVTGSRRSNDG